MKINWNSVKAQHVSNACELVADGSHAPKSQAKGIFVVVGDNRLPAKHVLRLAYLIANNMELSHPLKFSSGEGTINRLRSLGFQVERLNPPGGSES